MEKWIPSLSLWKRVSARGKPPGKPSAPKLACRAVSHRPLPFPTATKRSRAPLSHRPYAESFYLQKPFLFLTQADISFAKKSGHFHLLITHRSDERLQIIRKRVRWCVNRTSNGGFAECGVRSQGCGVLGTRFWVRGSGFGVSCQFLAVSRQRSPVARCWILDAGCLIKQDIEYQESSIEHQIKGSFPWRIG